MLIETLKANFEYEDPRGNIRQLVRRGYSQINVITSKLGVIRGGHYHKYNTEAFYIISGRCKVTATREAKTEIKEFKTGDFFRVGPYVLHDFEYLEDTTLISMYSLGVELNDETMDIYT